MGSVTGTDMGIPLPGGTATLPLNWDVFTDLTLSLTNSWFFTNFMGTLNGLGGASAVMNLPPFAGGYFTLYFAFALNDPWDYASNAVAVYIVP